MSVLIKNMEMPKGCIYANDNDQTEYCPLLNHDDVPFCQYIESEPEIAIGIDERPVYCPLSDVPEPCENTVSRQAAIDARRYTFGNDEFSLEAAYHDCKLVFDGITDDDSFQEADTGLILYYANEIIYALQEALEGKDTNVPANDCVSRQAAIDANTRAVER